MNLHIIIIRWCLFGYLEFKAWVNGNAMFHDTFICYYVSEANLFVSVFVEKCLMMLKDVKCTAFKMFVTQMSNYFFVISFQLMFYKALRYRFARAEHHRLLSFV